MRNYALRAYFVSQRRRLQALLIRTSFSEAANMQMGKEGVRGWEHRQSL